MEIISLLLVGIIVGILAGLFGVGGGTIIVPVLVWIFHIQAKVPSTHLMHMAIGTSLATIVFTSMTSILAHHRYGAIRWPVVIKFIPGIIIGALVGATIADALPNNTLKIIFAIFLLIISVQLGLGAQPAPHRQLPGWLGMNITSSIIGTISSIVGIGGGAMTVPFLIWCNVPIRNAIATSAACGFPIALTGAVGFVITGWHTHQLPAWSTGYIYWPAFIGITPTSLLFAPIGAKLAHSIPVTTLKRFFALLLVIIGIKMLMNASSA